MQLTIAQGLPATVVAFILALIGCELGLLSATASLAGRGAGRVGWICLAVFGIGVDGICAPQIVEVISMSNFGSNVQVTRSAVAEAVGVAVLTAFVAVATLVLADGRLGGALVGGLVVGVGAVLAHVLLLNGMVDPGVALRGPLLIASGAIAGVVAVMAMRLRSSGSRVGSGVAAVVLAASTVAAERLDISAASVRSGGGYFMNLTLQQIGALPTGILGERLLVPLLIVTAMSAIGLCFAGMQVGLTDRVVRLRDATE